ncbi:MAG: tail fiber domain-containing protein, partial [Acinetobacter sp.]
GISTTLDGKAGKGANRDITSLSGLTTPLDLKQGGTGATDAAGARTALGLGSGDAPQFSGLNIRNSGDIISEMYNSNVSASVIGTKTQWHYNASENPSAVMLVRRNASNTIGQIVVTMPNTAGVVQLTGTSGRDYKEAIAPADSAEAMARVMGLDLVTFIYKDDALRRVRFGIIAEEAEKVAPQYIKHFKFPIEGTETYDDEGNQINVEYRDRPVVDTNPIVMDLLGTVQYQQKMIKDMAESIEILESRLT